MSNLRLISHHLFVEAAAPGSRTENQSSRGPGRAELPEASEPMLREPLAQEAPEPVRLGGTPLATLELSWT